MKAPKTPLNSNLTGKITSYLVGNEGCSLQDIEFTKHGSLLTVKDAFGFVFSIEVKTVGRAAMNEVVEPYPKSNQLLERVK